MQWLGDYERDVYLHFLWSTNAADGASITRATDGEVRVYKDNGITQSTLGITDTEDFDGLIGIHACTIDLRNYTSGHDYSVVLQGATIDGKTVNAVLAHFSIENRHMRGTNNAALASVCTEPRLSELDAANIPSDLDDVLSDTDETQSKLPDNYIMGSSVTTDKDDEIDAIHDKLPDDKIAGSSDATSLESKHGTGSWITATTSNIAAAVWDALHADHQLSGSMGEYLTKIYNKAKKVFIRGGKSN